MPSKSHMHKRCGTLRKESFSARGYAEIHIQRPFWDKKKDILKIIVSTIQIVNIYSNAYSTHRNFYF
jgi:hypothetical protein